MLKQSTANSTDMICLQTYIFYAHFLCFNKQCARYGLALRGFILIYLMHKLSFNSSTLF